MNSIADNNEFNPSGVGLKNGNFIGLPYNETSANIILIPVPWDVTVSFGEGTALGAQAIREASVQLDLCDPDVKDAWKLGIYMLPEDDTILNKRNFLRSQAKKYIDFLEAGGDLNADKSMEAIRALLNEAGNELNEKIYRQAKSILENDKIAAVVGGDHSVPLGLMKAVSEKYKQLGVLQIDAHHDLRNSYEGLSWSHASIFYNALKHPNVGKIVQIGIRDYCEEELEMVEREGDRITVFFDQQLKENKFAGIAWIEQCEKIIEELPQDVYISFDIDGLDPKLCPHTGTPVPGGLEFNEVTFLFKKLIESGRRIVAFDVCETGNHPWDANVGARIVYKLSNLAGRSMGLI
ncbi:MAG TPA: agmatinase family protein [Mariniphaga sp.]|nr:agmatinase family protein [Mariniphaga sp.]